MKPKWTDTYIVHVGPRTLEIDRPTGKQRVIEQKPIREIDWRKIENKWRGS